MKERRSRNVLKNAPATVGRLKLQLAPGGGRFPFSAAQIVRCLGGGVDKNWRQDRRQGFPDQVTALQCKKIAGRLTRCLDPSAFIDDQDRGKVVGNDLLEDCPGVPQLLAH